MKQRPISVIIISIILFINSILLSATFIKNAEIFLDIFSKLGFSIITASIPISFIFNFILSTGSAVGLLLGARWSWWTSTFYSIYSAVRYFRSITTSITISNQYQSISSEINYYLLNYGTRTIICILIFILLYKSSTLEYFKISQGSKFKLAIIEISLTSLFYILTIIPVLLA